MTTFERIRMMSASQMATWLAVYMFADEWLENKGGILADLNSEWDIRLENLFAKRKNNEIQDN